MFLSYYLCDACYFVFSLLCVFSWALPPLAGLWVVPYFHFVLVRLFVSPPPRWWPAGGFRRWFPLSWHVRSPSIRLSSSHPPPATLAVRGRFLTVVCLIIAPSSSRPPRHSGGTREVFYGGLPYHSACVFLQSPFLTFFLAS